MRISIMRDEVEFSYSAGRDGVNEGSAGESQRKAGRLASTSQRQEHDREAALHREVPAGDDRGQLEQGRRADEPERGGASVEDSEQLRPAHRSPSKQR